MDYDVIIPVKNGAKFINQCLDSVLGQNLSASNIFVVDDASTDETADITKNRIAKYPQIKLLQSHGLGVSAARNQGIKESNASYLAFLDVDDYWDPTKLKKQVLLFETNKDLGMVYVGCNQVFEAKQSSETLYLEPKFSGDCYEALLSLGNVISGSASSVLIKKTVFSEIGLFDESLSYAEDWDLWLRISNRFRIDCVKEPLVSVRMRADSVQGQVSVDSLIKYYTQYMDVYFKNLDQGQISKRQKKLITKMLYQIWLGLSGDSAAVRELLKKILTPYPRVNYKRLLRSFNYYILKKSISFLPK